ncbi:MAG: LamG domain-containing protein [Actinobacteria bacterium]|nr:LamG domain-containing protein [Actinomycetota bacterium]
MADRTDYSQTFAEPGGGFTFDASPQPVRVQQPDGSWVPVDTTLVAQPNGAIRPAAITTGLVLSGGGSGPLYTLSAGGKSLAVSWPDGSLPTPSVSGSTATYPSVLPGVNLLLSATPTGVSELLQVTSASAASNPALAKLTFPVAASGLSLATDSLGNVSASDTSGTSVFAAPAPQIWDSAGPPDPSGVASASLTQPDSALTAGEEGPVPGDHTAVMPVTTSAGSFSLTPQQSVLAGSGTVYPVYIDPVWNSNEADSWSDVWQHGDGAVGGDWQPTSSFGGLRSGVYCQPDNNGNCIDPNPDSTWGKVRSYLNFSIPHYIWDSGYVDAQLQTNETWSWACSQPSTVELYRTSFATYGLDWNNKPSEDGQQDSNYVAYGNTCPAHGVTFDATPALTYAANNHTNAVTLELRAKYDSESNWNVDTWKRFSASSVNLEVDYRHPPDKPTGRVTQGTFDAATGRTVSDCATSAPGDYVNAATPVMQATDDDTADAQQPNGYIGEITTEFDWSNLNNANSNTFQADQNYQTPPFTFRSTFPWTVTNGDTYQWSVYGQTDPYTDSIGKSAPSLKGPSTGLCYFTADRNPPATPASGDITSDVYTSGTPSGRVGQVGHFTFSDPANADPSDGKNDVVGYFYGIDNPNPDVYVPAATDGTATVTITPFNPAELDLYVQAVDRAGNVSPGAAQFRIITNAPPGNIATLAWWKLNNGSGTTTETDSTGNGNDISLSSQGSSFACASTAGPDGYECSLQLDGSSGRAYTTLPVAGNNGSFTVSAWVNLSSCSSTCVAVSQGGTNVSGFSLGYQHSCGCWAFSMPASDSASATVYKAQSPASSAKTGTWTQLTGVYDETHQQLLLYVNGGDGVTPGNGVPAGSTSAGTVQPWAAPASQLLRLGDDGTASAGPDFWNGNLSGACAFYGHLSAADVQALYDNGSGDGCAALFTEYP